MVAFGFPPSFEDSQRFDLPERQLFRAVEDALDELGWNYSCPDRWRFKASVPMSFFSWGESLTVVVENDGWVVARSQSNYPLQWIDWGRNEGNVRRFFRALEDVVDDHGRRKRRRRDDDDRD